MKRWWHLRFLRHAEYPAYIRLVSAEDKGGMSVVTYDEMCWCGRVWGRYTSIHMDADWARGSSNNKVGE